MRGTAVNWKSRKPLCALAILLGAFFILLGNTLAQSNANASLQGKVSNSSGAAVPNARISIKNVATGTTISAQTGANGSYRADNLPPGDYEISVSADSFNTQLSKVTLATGNTQTLDITLTAALSLQDLGISSTQAAGNPQEQARLNKRSHMLKVHQELGLITLGPLVATVVAGTFAGGKTTVTSSTDRDFHAALGSATVGLYAATAYYAIFAPKIHGTKVEGNIKLHKALALIHGPGMILTPILGEMAFSQRSQGEKVHGIARLHGQVAIVTAGAYGAAILSVSLRSGPTSHAVQQALGFLGLHHGDDYNTLTDAAARAELGGTLPVVTRENQP